MGKSSDTSQNPEDADDSGSTGHSQQPNKKRVTPTGCTNCANSTAGEVTPSNIFINHLYVYNYSPDETEVDASALKAPINLLKYQSPAASSGPICRICHEGDLKEDLVSPCLCTGTVGLVHKTCMERWLSMRNDTNDKCEICNYTFFTKRHPKSLMEWLRTGQDTVHSRNLMGDTTCFLLLTPLAIVSSFLCIEGSKRQARFGNKMEAASLMALAVFLITIYFLWNVMTIRYHIISYLRWRTKNQRVKLMRTNRVSTSQLNRTLSNPDLSQEHAISSQV